VLSTSLHSIVVLEIFQQHPSGSNHRVRKRHSKRFNVVPQKRFETWSSDEHPSGTKASWVHGGWDHRVPDGARLTIRDRLICMVEMGTIISFLDTGKRSRAFGSYTLGIALWQCIEQWNGTYNDHLFLHHCSCFDQ
jgi:hypothetical protein